MSFTCSIADVGALVQLGGRTVEGAKIACGHHDDLTYALSSLNTILEFLQSEVSTPGSPVNRAGRNRRTELQSHMTGSEVYLRSIDSVFTKFSTLSDNERRGRKLSPKIRFGNGEVQDLAEIRLKISAYTTAITMSLRLMALGSRGAVERRMSHQKGRLEGVHESVNLILAQLNSTSPDGSALASYSNDSKRFWRSIRRELVTDGFQRSAVQGKKDLILSYVRELGARGVLDYSTAAPRSLASRGDVKQLKASCTNNNQRMLPGTKGGNRTRTPQAMSWTSGSEHSFGSSRTFVGPSCSGEDFPVSWEEKHSVNSDLAAPSLVLRTKSDSTSIREAFSPIPENENRSEKDLLYPRPCQSGMAVNTLAHDEESSIQHPGGISIPYPGHHTLDSNRESRSQFDENSYTQMGARPLDRTFSHFSMANSCGEIFQLEDGNTSDENQFSRLPSLFDLVQRCQTSFGPYD